MWLVYGRAQNLAEFKLHKKTQPAMESKKATRNRNVGVRPFNDARARQCVPCAWTPEFTGRVAFNFSNLTNNRERHFDSPVVH